MFVERIALAVFDANCYLIAPEQNGPCVVVDPGAGSVMRIKQALDRNGLSVGAVLLTHGHPDHVWDAAQIAQDNPVFIPAPDEYRLDDPLTGLGAMRAMAASLFASEWIKPKKLHTLTESSDMVELISGVSMRVIPAPGHTEGSSLFFFQGPISGMSESPIAAFTGDVIFNGSVGRTDLPGGDDRQMLHTLRTLMNAVDPQTFLLPGHGPVTTMAEQIQSNPYLKQAKYAG